MSILKPDIPGYRILRRLGNGGMSEIWLAEQVALARPVAIKIVSLGAEAEARIARFRQEAALIARFDHPNVVGIIEFGETADGRLFFSMPYVPNGTLAEAGLHGDGPRMREVLAQILDALAYIHEHGVVHRDVKPENVLFDSVGRARLADFGVSRSIEGVSRHTRAGETFGSSHYMSPEQARGELPDGRSDLYSVGAIAYEMLVGTPPFQGPDDLSVALGHLQAPIPRLPEHLSHWQGWIDSALAKKPERRPANAAAMRHALARIPEQARAAWFRRLQPLFVSWGLPAAIAVALALAVWRFSVMDRPEPAGETTAQTETAPATGTSSPATATPSDSSRMETPDEASSTGNAQISGARTEENSQPGGDVILAVPDTTQAAASVDPQRAGSGESQSSAAIGSRVPVSSETTTTRPATVANATPRQRGNGNRASLATNVATAPASAVPPPPAFAATFESVPKIPLFVLAGSPDEQIRRIDDYLDNGRRAIEADRVNVESQRRDSDDREQRQLLRNAYDTRKANYETWRRQLLNLREKAEDLQ